MNTMKIEEQQFVNILFDEGFHPKYIYFSLAKLDPVEDKTHVSMRVMGTYGYCAPEYAIIDLCASWSNIIYSWDRAYPSSWQ